MTAQHLKIALDLDGVIADFHGKLIEECGPPVSMAGWGWKTWYPRRTTIRGFQSFLAWTKDKPWEKAERMSRDPETYRWLQPLPGARKGVRTLAQAGHTLFIVTARPKGCEDVTITWVKKWLRGDIADVVVVGSTDEKVKFLKSINPHVFLDDNALTIVKARLEGLYSVVFTQPWNMKVEPPRSDGWRHFLWAMK